MKKNKNLFVSFEGPEASGKSSQIKILSKYLKKNKIPHIITREPGGTKVGEKLRKIILDKKANITPSEEILLLMSARLNHINNVILPSLKKGKLVISDRFADSTFVYQGYVNDFGLKKTLDLHKKLLNNFLPTKTFLFILNSNEINRRLKLRKNKNKYDKINKDFHNKVIRGYKKISKNNKRFYTIDATKSLTNISEKIIREITKLND
tara:strand:- start:320 stop:943 length:624 start_codon:yes stop_codon:yes gene_type:complete